jgi:hypothetical protein
LWGLFDHHAKSAPALFAFTLTAVGNSIFAETFSVHDFFVVVADGSDVAADGSEEESNKGRAIWLPTD